MREIRMEVVSREDAIEYCCNHNISFEDTYLEDGKLIMVGYAQDEPDEAYEKYLERMANHTFEDTYICTQTVHGVMYLADRKKCSNGTTFERALAQKFTWSKASQRVVFMNRVGAYEWKAKRAR